MPVGHGPSSHRLHTDEGRGRSKARHERNVGGVRGGKAAALGGEAAAMEGRTWAHKWGEGQGGS